MKVADYGPQAWFLLKDESRYYLSVRCQKSFVEFELLVQLNAAEYSEYHALGHVYIDYLASRISYWADEYTSRDLSKQLSDQVHQTIMAWKATQDEDAL
ncbi:hypothetical protein EON80_20475 [bacterium]|nr:MAG: hypothetical protein EON80_20475 [bacterium]